MNNKTLHLFSYFLAGYIIPAVFRLIGIFPFYYKWFFYVDLSIFILFIIVMIWMSVNWYRNRINNKIHQHKAEHGVY